MNNDIYALDMSGLVHRALATYPAAVDTACGQLRLEARMFATSKTDIFSMFQAARYCIECKSEDSER